MNREAQFSFYMPVDIRFGEGRIAEIGSLSAGFGRRVMLATTPWPQAQRPMFERVIRSLEEAGLRVTLFDEVSPNPTVEQLERAVQIARREGIDVLLGVGGGSAMDAAKAIAVGVTNEGPLWDYSVSMGKAIAAKPLPIVLVPTTAGTGAHITQGAVVTNTALKHKSAIIGRALFPSACIVDPELTLTLPHAIRACTGFDAFSHAFESFIHRGGSFAVDSLAMLAMRLIVQNLERALADPTDRDAICSLSYADTLSGICNANAGTTLPHSMGQAISGMFPRVAHGEALAAVYPAVLRRTWEAAPKKFAAVAALFDPKWGAAPEREAACALPGEIEGFLKRTGLTMTLSAFGVRPEDAGELAKSAQRYSDTGAHPLVLDAEQIRELYLACF